MAPRPSVIEVPEDVLADLRERLARTRWPEPRHRVEPHVALAHWTETPLGGHPAALEAPELLLDDVRAFLATPGPAR